MQSKRLTTRVRPMGYKNAPTFLACFYFVLDAAGAFCSTLFSFKCCVFNGSNTALQNRKLITLLFSWVPGNAQEKNEALLLHHKVTLKMG